jgi:hypothetical protein
VGTTLATSNGTAALPSITFQDSLGVVGTTGLFRPAFGVLGISTNGVERMRITDTGNVGLSKANPEYQLDLSTDGARKLTSTAWLTGSDARIKDDIQPANLQECVSLVKNIPLKRFAWKDSYAPVTEDRHVLGWIAQDVEQYLPKAVLTTAEHGLDDFKSLNTDQLLKSMWGALQYALLRLDALESRV